MAGCLGAGPDQPGSQVPHRFFASGLAQAATSTSLTHGFTTATMAHAALKLLRFTMSFHDYLLWAEQPPSGGLPQFKQGGILCFATL